VPWHGCDALGLGGCAAEAADQDPGRGSCEWRLRLAGVLAVARGEKVWLRLTLAWLAGVPTTRRAGVARLLTRVLAALLLARELCPFG
jgi:hypothetical protein